MKDNERALCGYGQCDSSHDFRGVIERVCGLPGSYEIDIKTAEGQEGVLHCGNHMIQHALWRDLSGMEALCVILSWESVKFRIEAVPVLPHATITIPLEGVFEEVGRRSFSYRWIQSILRS